MRPVNPTLPAILRKSFGKIPIQFAIRAAGFQRRKELASRQRFQIVNEPAANERVVHRHNARGGLGFQALPIAFGGDVEQPQFTALLHVIGSQLANLAKAHSREQCNCRGKIERSLCAMDGRPKAVICWPILLQKSFEFFDEQ